MFKRIKKEISKHQLAYFLVAILLLSAFTLRVWRIDKLLGFYFDQGRDALVIQRILHGDLILIGPVTGLEGIFLGPFYYYFLTPGYFLGAGNPVVASIWQTFFIVLGYLVTFSIARLFISFRSAIVILILFSFSYLEIKDNRWLANPVPTTFFGPLTVLLLTLSFKKSKLYLPMASFSLGLLLQLEASSAFFLTLITTIFILIYRKTFGWSSIVISLGTFLLTLIPQILFELKNNFLLSRNLARFLTIEAEGQKAFAIPNFADLQNRLELYSTVFLNRLTIDSEKYAIPVFLVFLVASIYICYKNWSKPAVKVISFWFFGILISFLFYQGNYGQINSYYFTPLMPLFFILVGFIVEYFLKYRLIKLIIPAVIFGLLFIQINPIVGYIASGIGEETINLESSSKAVKFVLADSKGQPFNVDVYVPPVIPYAYTYLFNYHSTQALKPSDKMESVLYTIHEIDLEKPLREEKWLARQNGIGKVVKEAKFGGIRVEKRDRLKYE